MVKASGVSINQGRIGDPTPEAQALGCVSSRAMKTQKFEGRPHPLQIDHFQCWLWAFAGLWTSKDSEE